MATSKIKGTATYEELHAYAIEAFTCDPENTVTWDVRRHSDVTLAQAQAGAQELAKQLKGVILDLGITNGEQFKKDAVLAKHKFTQGEWALATTELEAQGWITRKALNKPYFRTGDE